MWSVLETNTSACCIAVCVILLSGHAIVNYKIILLFTIFKLLKVFVTAKTFLPLPMRLGTLCLLICGALEKHLLTYLLAYSLSLSLSVCLLLTASCKNYWCDLCENSTNLWITKKWLNVGCHWHLDREGLKTKSHQLCCTVCLLLQMATPAVADNIDIKLFMIV